MEKVIDDELRREGRELVHKYGEKTVSKVIADVEELDTEETEDTAELLREITGLDGE